MKKNRFKVGDLIKSQCGDQGLVIEVSNRPDDDGSNKLGVYALWAKGGLSFWMNLNEPTIQLHTEKKLIRR